MAYARQVELVDLSSSRPVSRHRSDSGYTPCESLASPSVSETPTITADETVQQPTLEPSKQQNQDVRNDGLSTSLNSNSVLGTVFHSKQCNSTGSFNQHSPKDDRNSDVVSAQITHALTGTSSAQGATMTFHQDFAESNQIPIETREELFRQCLGQPTVDVDELRRIVWTHGVPTATWARPLAWKLLTGYLPPDRSDWDSTLAAKRERYWNIVHDVTVDPSEQPLDGDHPLNDAASSQWREFFDDSETRSVIQRDVVRTHPDLHRFAPLRDSLERILFVYAKCHKSLGYRQGMNELAAPFLIVFSDVRGVDMSDVEADVYFCFEDVMAEMTTCYVPKETETDGIGRQLRELQALLRIKDPELEQRLESLGIDPRFYGLRWIRLWVCHEFSLPDCLSLWDSFLTAEVRLPWIRYVCVAMLIRLRKRLLHSDFTSSMKLLLNYPDCDVAELLRIADRLRTSNAVIVRTARG